MPEEELVNTTEQKQIKQHQRRWVRIPEWWSVIISLVQFLVITIALGSAGWYFNKTAKQEAVRREVAVLCTHLEDSDPTSYRAATEALVNLGATGTEVIRKYATNGSCIPTTPKTECRVPWQKARLLHRQLVSSAQDNEDRKTAGELISSSWICYDYDPGLDMEFYEILKNEPDVTCPIVLNNLEKLKDYPHRVGEDRMVSRAALLVLFEKACPGKSSPQLESLKLNFKQELDSEIAGYFELLELKNTFYPPWREDRPSVVTAGPFDAKDESWRGITFDTFQTFSKRGSVASAVMWHRLEEEGLPARLIFGQFILYFEKDAPINKDGRSQFDSLVDLGLAPTADSESKAAAISAVANLHLKSHKQSLQRLADSDPDPSLRELARDALAQTFSSGIYNSPSGPTAKP